MALAEGHVQPHVCDLICDVNLAVGQKPAHDTHLPGALPQAKVERRPSAKKADDCRTYCVGWGRRDGDAVMGAL